MDKKRMPRKPTQPPAGKSLLELFPVVAAEWHHDKNEYGPEMFTASSNKSVWWKCPLDERHEYPAPIARRTSGSKCGVCNNKVIIEGVNDLASQEEYTHIIREWHHSNEKKPTDVAPFSNIDITWECSKCHHVWNSRLPNRTKLGSGCPECSKEDRKGKRNSVYVSEIAPLVAEWHSDNDTAPDKVTLGSSYNALWSCQKDNTHIWKTPVFNRAKGSGCPYCGKVRIHIEKQNMLTMFPELAKQVHQDNPESVNPFSTTPILWKCQTNPEHLWMATPRSRTVPGTGCSVCYGNGARREPLTNYPDLVASWSESNEINASEFSAGSAYMATWTCITKPEHPEWKAAISDRVRGRGCPTCASKNFASRGEKELAKVVKSLVGGDFTIRRNVRDVVSGCELDIYIPSKNLAVEFNGVYWHSDKFKSKDYHVQKTQACADENIQLIHVWEDDWRERRDIVVRALAHRLGATGRLNEPGVLLMPDESLTLRYGARRLAPEVISSDESGNFLKDNHIQGRANGTLHVGLRDSDGVLRAVFAAKRNGNQGHEGEWTIERYATRGIIPGGFTKLMAYAQTQIAERSLGVLSSWVTFSDAVISDGGLYSSHGFIEGGTIPPDYRYVVNGERVHKFNYRLKRFRDDPTLQYSPDLSERELALLNDIPRIWDSGKTRWVKRV